VINIFRSKVRETRRLALVARVPTIQIFTLNEVSRALTFRTYYLLRGEDYISNDPFLRGLVPGKTGLSPLYQFMIARVGSRHIFRWVNYSLYFGDFIHTDAEFHTWLYIELSRTQ
jgi:hypothetical protein